MNISDQLRAARKLRGLSQKALAERLNLSPSNISYYEMPTTRHSIDTLQKVSEALDCALYICIVPKSDPETLWSMDALKMTDSL